MMTDRKDIRRVKRLPVTEEFISLLFENPQNYYVNSGIPEGTNYVRMYEEPARSCTYIEFQNDNWDSVPEGAKIPEFDIEIRERFCNRCDNEMMYDEEKENQYCPRCERRFQGKII